MRLELEINVRHDTHTHQTLLYYMVYPSHGNLEQISSFQNVKKMFRSLEKSYKIKDQSFQGKHIT